MNGHALFALLARRSVAIVLAAVALAMIGICWLQGAVGTAIPRAFFTFLYNVVGLLLLASIGSFLARALNELQAVRLARVIPQLRRQATLGAAIVVPVAAAAVTAFIYWRLPQQSRDVAALAFWALAVLLMTIQLALANTWLAAAVTAVAGAKLSLVMVAAHQHPAATGAVAILLAIATFALRHARFLPVPDSSWDRLNRSRWLRTPFSPQQRARVGGETLPQRSRAIKPHPVGVTVQKLTQAGIFERFGHAKGHQMGRVILWVTVIYLVFLALAYTALPPDQKSVDGLARQVFLREGTRGEAMRVLGWLFAGITGMVAYIAAIMLDASPRPELWHPVSRTMKGRALYWSRVQQNLRFAGVHAAVMSTALGAVVLRYGQWPKGEVIAAYLLPSVFAAMLMLFPQALFPDGAATFQKKTNPLTQIGAGLLGGAICLLTIYWSAHWPAVALEPTLPRGARAGLLAVTVLAAYVVYGWVIHRRFRTADLRIRAG